MKKHTKTSPPRRIATLEVSVPRGNDLSDADRQVLEHAARACPVRLSISEAIQVPVTFAWGLRAELIARGLRSAALLRALVLGQARP